MPSENTESGEGDTIATDSAPPLPPTTSTTITTNNNTEEAVEAAVPPSILNTPTATKRPYVYRDFAQDDTDYGGSTEEISIVDGRGVTNQKLPAKLHAMLSDPDLVTTITWMPHGRSWKILNRDLFARFALPKYFGHTNHASFIRIVNAWGFRRVVATGPDRDTYYHELFLRSKTNLHVKMKRLPTSHRKTPMDKNESSPNFYELSEHSPLPETKWLTSTSQQQQQQASSAMGGSRGGMSATTTGMGMMDGYAAAGMMGMGGGLMGNMMMQQQQQQMMSQSMGRMMPGMGMMGNPFYPSVNPAAAAAMGGMTSGATAASNVASMPTTTGASQSHLSENENLLQLQRENDTLMRQLLQLQRQMNPPSSMTATTTGTSKAIEEGGGASTNTSAVAAIHHDNQQLIRQVMQLQEELPQELRIEIPPELLGLQQPQSQQQPEGKTEEESEKIPHKEV